MPAWRGYRASIRQWRARVGLLRKLELQAGGASEWLDVGAAGEPPGGLAGAVPARSPGSAISSRGLGRNTPGPAVLAAAGAESAGGASGSCIRLDWAEFPPVLAVRLQALFGLGDTLRIAGAGWR